MDEHFKCQACQSTGHICRLHHRFTMPGDYCKTCAQLEICHTCGETHPAVTMGYGRNKRCMCWYCVCHNAGGQT